MLALYIRQLLLSTLSTTLENQAKKTKEQKLGRENKRK